MDNPSEWEEARATLWSDRQKENGFFVRDYDGAHVRMWRALHALHKEMVKLDNGNLKPWKERDLMEMINDWAEGEDLRQL